MVGVMNTHLSWEEIAGVLTDGHLAVLPTDTLYGVVGSALKPAAVERIYDLRQRERNNPMIVLLAHAGELARFKIAVDPATGELFERVWPGPVSMIIAAPAPELEYLHRGTQSIAFRVPAKPELRALLAQTGPLSAPSANLAGHPPARTVEEARAYFGDEVHYVDGGVVDGPASALVDVRQPRPRVLRPAPGFNVSAL